jgi:hypothetical protein
MNVSIGILICFYNTSEKFVEKLAVEYSKHFVYYNFSNIPTS